MFTKNHEDQDQLILFFVFIIYALNLCFVGQKCKANKAYINAKILRKIYLNSRQFSDSELEIKIIGSISRSLW